MIVASNESLAEAVRDGRFRSDLYMRLSPATRVRLPTLRERVSDLPFLSHRLTERAGFEPDVNPFRLQLNRALGLPETSPVKLSLPDDPKRGLDCIQLVIPGPSWRRLLRHRWSGNVRELAMVLQPRHLQRGRGRRRSESGLTIRSKRLQVDSGLVNQLLEGGLDMTRSDGEAEKVDPDVFRLRLHPGQTLNAVSVDMER